jgi:hypothetical protein
MTNEERNNILDQHKTIYDGYVTEYAQGENKQPLYVQDFANDKGGITVNNKGEVKPYTNVGINESIDGRLDMIGDGEDDLRNGTANMKNGGLDIDDRGDYISLGMMDNEDDNELPTFDSDRNFIGFSEKNGDMSIGDDEDDRDLSMYNPYYGDNKFDFDTESELDEVDDTILDLKPEWSNDYEDEEIVNDIFPDNFDEVDEEEKDEFLNKLNESLDMFRRFNRYN